MAVTVKADVGAADANAYDTVANVTARLEAHPQVSQWTSKGADAQARIAILLTEKIDEQELRGSPASTTQALRFPRTGLKDRDGSTVASDALPEPLLQAFALGCLAIARGDMTPTGLEGFNRAKSGTDEVELRHHRAPSDLPEEVRRRIAPFLLHASTSQVSVLRS